MTTTIKLQNNTAEPCKLIIDEQFLFENIVYGNIAHTGTSYKVFLTEDTIYRQWPIVYGTVPAIEEDPPQDRTWLITLNDQRDITQGWEE